MSKSRLKLLAELEEFQNLYYVNRTETDIATLAGMEAAELGIRSEYKAFEFQIPGCDITLDKVQTGHLQESFPTKMTSILGR